MKGGFIDRKVAKALPRAFEKRQESDYGDFAEVTRQDATALRDEIFLFLEECERVLDRELSRLA